MAAVRRRGCYNLPVAPPTRRPEVPMSLAAGTHLGPYEIQSAIGAGGMREVYKARDTRLQCAVALEQALVQGRSRRSRTPPSNYQASLKRIRTTRMVGGVSYASISRGGFRWEQDHGGIKADVRCGDPSKAR
jgi:serine/threonine protein kinase